MANSADASPQMPAAGLEQRRARSPSPCTVSGLPNEPSHMSSTTAGWGEQASICATSHDSQSRPQSAGESRSWSRPCSATRPQSARSMGSRHQLSQESHDLQIAEDDDGGDDIDEAIENAFKLQASQPESRRIPRDSQASALSKACVTSAATSATNAFGTERSPGSRPASAGASRPPSAGTARVAPDTAYLGEQPGFLHATSSTSRSVTPAALAQPDVQQVQQPVVPPSSASDSGPTATAFAFAACSGLPAPTGPPVEELLRTKAGPAIRSARAARPSSARGATRPAARVPQRPSSARGSRSVVKSPGRKVQEVDENCEWPLNGRQPSSPSSRMVYSRQMLSRYTMERDGKWRMMSVMERQLERYRDLIDVWEEQRNAIRNVIYRRERELEKRDAKRTQLFAERAGLVQKYEKHHEQMMEGLKAKMEAVKSKIGGRNVEIQESASQESQASEEIDRLEKENEALRHSLDQAVTRLNEVRSQMSALQAGMANANLSHLRKTMQDSPELMHALSRIEAFVKEKEELHSESQKTKLDILQAQDELNRRRSMNMRFEDLVKKLASTGNGYVLDVAARKEAGAILANAVRLRAIADAEIGGDYEAERRARNRSHSPCMTRRPENYHGRRCCACHSEDDKRRRVEVYAGLRPATDLHDLCHKDM